MDSRFRGNDWIVLAREAGSGILMNWGEDDIVRLRFPSEFSRVADHLSNLPVGIATQERDILVELTLLAGQVCVPKAAR